MRNPDVDDRDPTIMAFKRGCSSGLTIGRFNNIRSVLRKAKPDVFSREVAVLPRTKSAFFEDGDLAHSPKRETLAGLSSTAGVLLLVCSPAQ